jgi:hypothetical protein
MTSSSLTSIVNVRLRRQVTQYDCNFPNPAPPGCTQYYFGSTTNSVQTYNYQGGQQLADQNQNICVR